MAFRTGRRHWSALSITHSCATLVRYRLHSGVKSLIGTVCEALGLETVFIHSKHTHTCNNVLCKPQLSTVQNLSEQNYFRHVVVFIPEGRGFPRSVSLSTFHSLPNSCVFEKTNTREKSQSKGSEWDVYGTTVIMSHDGSITPLTVTSSNCNNRGN